MIVDLGFENQKESNLFLRALWANFAKRYGKCAWQYSPYTDREKKIIILGFMDIDLADSFAVYVHYKKRAVINKLEFINNSNNEEISNEIKEQFNEIIKETKIKYKNPDTKYLNITISSNSSISNYYSDFFRIEPYGNGLSSITFGVKSYGDNDAEFIFKSKVKSLLDILSVLTNSPFIYENIARNIKLDKEEETFYDDDFIDGYPIKNKQFILTNYGKQIIEKVLAYDNNIEDDNLEKLLNACMHFHAARKYDAQIYDLYTYGELEEVGEGVYKASISLRNQRLFDAKLINANIEEIATVSYISSLEVLSTIGFDSKVEKCKECNQMVYSISSRVKELLRKYFPDRLAKELHSYYSSRSKYLHEGRLLTHPYTGTSIPQLDYNNPCGCKVVSEIPLLNLREYTSYCIRRVIRENFIK